jgi:hypothetical protein
MLATTLFVRSYAQWRIWLLNVQKPALTQERELLSLVRRAASTRFGRDHDFGSIASVQDFQDRVPLRRYEDFWNDYWKTEFPKLDHCSWPGEIPYFALTAGTTTGVTKYIPCSREMLAANFRAAQDILFHHLLNRPKSRILDGKGFMLGGSTDLHEEAPGILSGDLSGIEANEVPWWVRPYAFPPRELALLADWKEKIDKVARLSLKENITAISGTPNWLLVLFDKLAELRPSEEQRLCNYYPDLELLVHGGVDFRPYANRFAELLEDSRAELREVYPASEAFVAIADRRPGEGLRLIVDNGVFFEFVPTEELGGTNPIRHWLGNAETELDYAVVVSTCAGAWAYILGDTIRFIELDPPRILVTGRTSYVLSAFGEHLINSEIEEAVATAAAAINANVVDYCVAPSFPDRPGDKGRHHYVVEFTEGLPSPDRLAVFAAMLDARLGELNVDYQQLRKADYALRAPMIDVIAPGRFAAWMKSRGQLGGQHKVPRIINNEALFRALKEVAGLAPGVEGNKSSKH